MFILHVLRFFYNIDKYIVSKMFFQKLISSVKVVYMCMMILCRHALITTNDNICVNLIKLL